MVSTTNDILNYIIKCIAFAYLEDPIIFIVNKYRLNAM